MIFIIIIFSPKQTKAQCFFNVPACGYSVSINYTILSIVPLYGAPPCPWGYNYNVTFSYTVTVIGINTCWDQNIEFQSFIYCNGAQSNQSASVYIPAPPYPTGAPINITYVGTVTTTTGPYNTATDCGTATPVSLGCHPHHVNFSAPGIVWQPYDCNVIGLPIELLSFDAKYQTENKEVFVSWVTASQLNNDYFTVERSFDGVNFEIVEVIDGAGTNSEILAYTCIDKKPMQGLVYYRLKQTDFDGKFKYSTTRAVNVNQTTAEVVIYPNPTTSTITIQASEQELQSIKIYNILGQDVSKLTKQLSKTDNSVVLDLSNLVNGLYSVKTLTTANKVYKK